MDELTREYLKASAEYIDRLIDHLNDDFGYQKVMQTTVHLETARRNIKKLVEGKS